MLGTSDISPLHLQRSSALERRLGFPLIAGGMQALASGERDFVSFGRRERGYLFIYLFGGSRARVGSEEIEKEIKKTETQGNCQRNALLNHASDRLAKRSSSAGAWGACMNTTVGGDTVGRAFERQRNQRGVKADQHSDAQWQEQVRTRWDLSQQRE